jgi:ribosomal protein S18 acetylase RimI-like enzyme
MNGDAITVVEADLEKPAHQQAILELTDTYARDPMGQGGPLSARVRGTLIAALRRHPTTHIFLAFAQSEAVGIATCFRGFSSFHAQPLLNIHDLAIKPGRRGQGIGRQLLDVVAQRARDLGCYSVTLEVGGNNRNARALYEAVGFRQAGSDEAVGPMVFMSKKL